ncbi:MAG: preprotein translocase subunit SecE [Endomicrobium sp.]|jgi:preprotein translocase SecE subunit|nr:preprotein translocase subunit SecE [Endomicrobium sp.]
MHLKKYKLFILQLLKNFFYELQNVHWKNTKEILRIFIIIIILLMVIAIFIAISDFLIRKVIALILL